MANPSLSPPQHLHDALQDAKRLTLIFIHSLFWKEYLLFVTSFWVACTPYLTPVQSESNAAMH